MSKKPIKRNENIMRLSREHHFGLLFCWKIRQGLKSGIAANRMTEYARYFATHFLLPHFKEEETILFSYLNDGLITKAIQQHKEINSQLAKLSTGDEESATMQLSELANMTDNHIRFEERELFPHLEVTLTNEQLEAAGRQLNDVHALPIKDDYKDEFWIK